MSRKVPDAAKFDKSNFDKMAALEVALKKSEMETARLKLEQLKLGFKGVKKTPTYWRTLENFESKYDTAKRDYNVLDVPTFNIPIRMQEAKVEREKHAERKLHPTYLTPEQVLRISEWGPAQGDHSAKRSEYDDLILPRKVFNISGNYIVMGMKAMKPNLKGQSSILLTQRNTLILMWIIFY